MAASPEKLGLKLLRALKREKDRGKTLLNCSSLSAIAAELGFSEAEFQKAFRFLAEKQAMIAADRPEGKAVLPSEQGEAMLAAKKRDSSWTMDRRLVLYGIIVALLSAVLAARCQLR